MARATTPLNDTQIKNAKPKASEYLLSDGGGLGLRIKKNGSKTWLFNYYRPHIKKRAQISFGIYPAVTLAVARKRRDEARALLADDIDPKEYREKIQSTKITEAKSTFEAVVREWVSLKEPKVSTRYAFNLRRGFEIHLFPDVGDIPISKLSAQLTIEVLKPLAAAGKLDILNRICRRINEVMEFAINTGRLQSNNLRGISKAFDSATHTGMYSFAPQELPDLISIVNSANIKLITRCLFEWQLHTMVRPGEAVKAAWSEIDFENRTWNISAETMKKKRPHTVPLTPQLLSLLEYMKPITGHREFIFPAYKNPRNHLSRETLGAALRRMGLQGKQTAHGLRALASTTLNEQGFDSDLIEAALAHVDKNQVRAAYNRTDYLERRRKMMCWWSAHIEAASKGDYSVTGNQHLKVV
ncbi:MULTISPECIES: integrase domain-containing protein [unclassified Pseudoalteromonas]|uniref:integrase domain-containing protein n=1 Tax=unclassified Pseudoalteromonas TaxID=194690 RepID=UPI00160382D6|nr:MULTISPECIES: integrase domain-containing protein [unclassified Pseudoalteromonas]MBB1282482.1 tyrosine-type recombinase/integrase [Pseudoalteromonas sp. SR41-1]MBH0068516.1 tyrosine-type recombinase/integrase [Pseudoalteromonas sp. NZS100]